MTIRYTEEYRSPEICRNMAEKIKKIGQKNIRLMEVCGTHTMSLFRSGIRSLLPETISLLSGPGCPVCVTAQAEIDAFIALSRKKNVILATFGDLVRVPGTNASLQKERADGKDIRIVYAASDAVEIARNHPDKHVVFAGVGFETTAPTIAASVLVAEASGVNNYFVYSAHKQMPPALVSLAAIPDIRIHGFLLPGHVSVILGTAAYQPFFDQYQIPCVIAGFEAGDILYAIFRLAAQIESGNPALENAYQRAVTDKGNLKAKAVMAQVFEPADAIWRGLGMIPNSGLKLREEFAAFDASLQFSIDISESEEPPGCACGEILTGIKIPPECGLYKKICTPLNPVGPCMVSSEGTCAAYYRYEIR